MNKQFNSTIASSKTGSSSKINSQLELVEKLISREINGTQFSCNNTPFSKNVPERFKMDISSIIPPWALKSGHIFMGFTDCNRYVLSYTIGNRDAIELDNFYSRMELKYFYKLYFWHFTPLNYLRRVSSLLLFSNSGVEDGNLLIEISSFGGNYSKLIVTGSSMSNEPVAYITILSLPPSIHCTDCLRTKTSNHFSKKIASKTKLVPSSSCCLEHSLAIHIFYERVQPYPRFNFDVQLNYENSVFINTGNSFHQITLNCSKSAKNDLYPQPIAEVSHPHTHVRTGLNNNRNRLLRCDFWFEHYPNCLSKILLNSSNRDVSKILSTAESETNETEKESLYFLPTMDKNIILETLKIASEICSNSVSTLILNNAHKNNNQNLNIYDSQYSPLSSFSISTTMSPQEEIFIPSPTPSPPSMSTKSLLNENLLNIKTTKLSSSCNNTAQNRKFFKTGVKNTLNKGGNEPEEKNCDIFEVGLMSSEEVFLERSLSSYRKRRNADKQYEFSEPDLASENVVPLKLTRTKSATKLLTHSNYSQKSIESPHPSISPLSLSSTKSDILKPISSNTLFPPEQFSPSSSQNIDSEPKSISQIIPLSSSSMSDKTNFPSFSKYLNCSAHVLRHYEERDDKNTDILESDDEIGTSESLLALTLNFEIHGPGYEKLVKKSKNRCEVGGGGVGVSQRTLEIEILSNEVAGMICLSSDLNFISCFDYDVHTISVSPDDGAVRAIAVLLILAEPLKNNSNSSKKSEDYSLLEARTKYELIFMFIWEPNREKCLIIYSGHMREIQTVADNWNPTKKIAEALTLKNYTGSQEKKRVLSNKLAVYEWKSLDKLYDSTGLICINLKKQKCSSSYQMSQISSFSPSHSALNFDFDDDLSD